MFKLFACNIPIYETLYPQCTLIIKLIIKFILGSRYVPDEPSEHPSSSGTCKQTQNATRWKLNELFLTLLPCWKLEVGTVASLA